MSDEPNADEASNWQRRLASQANNRAWALSEQAARSADEDEEMLQAAHAAMYLWRSVGQVKNHAHAAQLVAHVLALLHQGPPARRYLARSLPVLLGDGAEPWEVALAHAVAANVAAAEGDAVAHRDHHAQAVRLIDALADDEEREILRATLRVVPQPAR